MNNDLHHLGLTAILATAQVRDPDFIIGGKDDPYLRRWQLRQEGPSGGLYLHQILRDDDDRALHDHPWDFSVYIIEGAYREIRDDCPDGEVYRAGSYRHIKAETAHRLIVLEPLWTLCFIGPRRREWGFHCPQGWIPWQQFTAADDKGAVGKGCGA